MTPVGRYFIVIVSDTIGERDKGIKVTDTPTALPSVMMLRGATEDKVTLQPHSSRPQITQQPLAEAQKDSLRLPFPV